MNFRAVLDEVSTWPIEERLRLLDELWERVVDDPEAIIPGDAPRPNLRLHRHPQEPNASRGGFKSNQG